MGDSRPRLSRKGAGTRAQGAGMRGDSRPRRSWGPVAPDWPRCHKVTKLQGHKNRRACHGCVSRAKSEERIQKSEILAGARRMSNEEGRMSKTRRALQARRHRCWAAPHAPFVPSCLRALSSPPPSLRRSVASSLWNVECRMSKDECRNSAERPRRMRTRHAGEVLITLSLYHLITASRGRRTRGQGSPAFASRGRLPLNPSSLVPRPCALRPFPCALNTHDPHRLP